MADVVPFVLIKPSISIGSPGTEFQCFAHKVEFAPDQDSNDNDTFCGSYRSYGQLRWTITLSMFQSFGDSGLWKALVPLAGTVVPITITPDDTDTAPAAGTIDNPTVTANVRVPPLPFLSAEVGEASDFDLDFDVQGTLSYTPDPGSATTAATGATAGTPGTWTPSGSTPPASVTALQGAGITASPATAWTTGQYVQTGTAGTPGQAHWSGTAWVAGVA